MKHKAKLARRKCESEDCDVMFTPRIRTQRFHSPKCKNKEAQKRYRDAQKGAERPAVHSLA